MKLKTCCLLLLGFTVIATPACTRKTVIVKSSKPLPPGQAKKLTGAKSAKQYAPGQQKKQ
ncbi:hypothetical protein HB364_10695 [Pseudoflavitalea sp. X16]|uniref:hypothetical protein n=1 Tax=Paraflavitalea devenefica TaxID=2716334 RepID=UPI0014216B7E|nr:hypothetical protein [Paraflavitalea devenefica]NII25552.1 hypothetical protein [Paraflavitalea devenefica]